MKNILVFPCGNENAVEILNSLSPFPSEYKVYGGSSTPNIGENLFKNYIGDLPFLNAPDFFVELNKIIEMYNIDFIFPTHDMVVYEFSKHAESINCNILCPEPATSEIIRDKFKTYKCFENDDFTPRIFEDTENLLFPVFVKPRIGELARNSCRIDSKEDLDLLLGKINKKDFVFCELLTGEEYTVECLTDNNGKLVLAEARRMTKYARGIFLESQLIEDKTEFTAVAEKINKKLSFTGLWYFQCKRDDNGKIKLLEIAQKVNGTMALLRIKGINLPYLSLQICLNVPFSLHIKTNIINAELKRYFFNVVSSDFTFRKIYIDIDSILFIDTPDSFTIAFLFQQLWRGIPITGYSKNEKALSKTGLSSSFFSNIINNFENITEFNSNEIFISNNSNLIKIIQEKMTCFNTSELYFLYDWKK